MNHGEPTLDGLGECPRERHSWVQMGAVPGEGGKGRHPSRIGGRDRDCEHRHSRVAPHVADQHAEPGVRESIEKCGVVFVVNRSRVDNPIGSAGARAPKGDCVALNHLVQPMEGCLRQGVTAG